MTDHKAEWPAGVLNREATLKLLREHNEWRRGASTPQTDPRMLGLALDAAIAALAAAPAASEGEDGAVATFTTGHCENKKKPGGCPLHNLHCGWPKCDRREVASQKEANRGR